MGVRTASLYEHVNKMTVMPTMSALGINEGSGAGVCAHRKCQG